MPKSRRISFYFSFPYTSHETTLVFNPVLLDPFLLITVFPIDFNQSIIEGSFRKTNHCTDGFVLDPKAMHDRISVPDGNSGRSGI